MCQVKSRRPSLSVIIPIWGVEKYIGKCARSLFESTLEDIEYIFVDDCTPDNSIDVLQSLMEEYPERKKQSVIKHHVVNKGLPQARRTGFEASTGEWITYCDSDDWVAPDMYEKMIFEAEKDGGDIACCDFVFLSDKEKLWEPTYDSTRTPSQLRIDLLNGSVSNAVWNKIVHRSVYEDNHIHFPELSMDEDDVLTVQLAYYAKHIVYVHECLYYHYDNPDPMTKQKDRSQEKRKIKEQIENRKWIVSFLESKRNDDLATALLFYKTSTKSLQKSLIWDFGELNSNTIKEFMSTYKELNKTVLYTDNFSIRQMVLYYLLKYIPSFYVIKKRIWK